MLLSSISSALLLTVCTLSSPAPIPVASVSVAPLALQPAPASVALASVANDGGDKTVGEDFADFPPLPGCPAPLGYSEDCVLAAQLHILLSRFEAIADHNADRATILQWSQNALASTTSPLEIAQIIARTQAMLAFLDAQFDATWAALDQEYLELISDACCIPGGVQNPVGLDGSFGPPPVQCPDGTVPDEECTVALRNELGKAKLEVFKNYRTILLTTPGGTSNIPFILALMGVMQLEFNNLDTDFVNDVIMECCDN